MKILCIADCHYPKFYEVEKLVKLDTNLFEAILWLGDNDQFLMEEVSHKFSHKHQIGVLGNHDPFIHNVLEEYEITDINLKVHNFNSISFIGFHGSVKLDSSEPIIGYTQNESIELLKEVKAVDVLVSHNSPYNIHETDNDFHKGFVGIIDYINKNKPKLCIHGHQHINKLTRLSVGTNVVSIYGARILDFDSLESKIII